MVMLLAFILLAGVQCIYAQDVTIDKPDPGTIGTTKDIKEKATYRYQGDVNIGYDYTVGKLIDKEVWNGETYKDKISLSRPLISTTHGVRADYRRFGWFVGLGVGAQYATGDETDYYVTSRWNTLIIPVFLNVKGYINTNNSKFSIYTTLSGGYSFVPYSGFSEEQLEDMDETLRGGLHIDYGWGINYGLLDVSIGYQLQDLKLVDFDDTTFNATFRTHALYVKIGLTF